MTKSWTVPALSRHKVAGGVSPLVMVTAYDAPSARMVDAAGADLILVGDTLAMRENAKKQLRVADALKLAESIGMPAWVQVDATKMEGIFKKVPDRDQHGAEIKEALIVELYSR